MFRASPAHGSTSSNVVPNIYNFTLSRLESALPQNQISHPANPIESTPFFQIAPFRNNSAPVTPASTTLTKHPPRNPIRMNTSTKHRVAPPPATTATNSYKKLYKKMRTTRSYHFPHSTPSRTSPLPAATNKSNLSPNRSSMHALRIRSGRFLRERSPEADSPQPTSHGRSERQLSRKERQP